MNVSVLQQILYAALDAGHNAWRFILLLANVYTGGMILLALFAANTDKYLTNDIWAHFRTGFPYKPLKFAGSARK